jgi:phytoene dehydrogenase-like protein
MEDRSILIIGAGVAGLATGCYARMNGYRTQIFEMASKPGGVCTSWHRQGYAFDGCIAWLVGSRAGAPMSHIWQELGALIGRQIVNHEEFVRIEGRDGRALVFYTDADRLEKHLCELAPADAAVSRAFCDVVRRFASLNQAPGIGQRGRKFTAMDHLGPTTQLLPVAPRLIDWLRLTWQEYAARYTDRFVRDAFRSVFDGPDFPLLLGVMQLAWMHARDAGYPIGGSLAFAQAIEQRYRELGGEITYGARVEKILAEGGRATGIRLSDGSEHHAGYVVSAADGHSTIFDMLDSRYVDERIRRQYTTQRIYAPLVLVSLGVARDLSDVPHALQFPLRTPHMVAGQVRDSLLARHYCYDPTMAPHGKSTLLVQLETNYDTWADLARDPGRYSDEKRSVADAVVSALDERFPGLAADVEVVDVATPITWERHTGNWRGAYQGWLPTRRAIASRMLQGQRNALPGLANFFMVGQWVVGSGLPSVAPAGRSLVKQLCLRDGRPFLTTIATHPPARILPDFGDGSPGARQ